MVEQFFSRRGSSNRVACLVLKPRRLGSKRGPAWSLSTSLSSNICSFLLCFCSCLPRFEIRVCDFRYKDGREFAKWREFGGPFGSVQSRVLFASVVCGEWLFYGLKLHAIDRWTWRLESELRSFLVRVDDWHIRSTKLSS